MTRSPWRLGSLVVAGALLGTGLLVGAPPAAAAGVAVVLSQPFVTGMVATTHGVVILDAGSEGGTLRRVDPATGAVLAVRELLPGTPTGNSFVLDDLTLAAGSLWVGEYWQDEVLRIDPVTLRTQAVISTGRSPSGVVSGGGSVWVPLTNDQAVARVDPGSNAVVATIAVGSPSNYVDSPYKAAWTGTDLVATLPATGRVAHIARATGRVTYDHPGRDTTFCADIHPVPGGYWLDDTECADSFFRWTASTHSITARFDVDDETPTSIAVGSTVHGGVLYTGEAHCPHDTCVSGQLVGRDLATGVEISRRTTPGDVAAQPRVVAGAWWTDDVDHSTVHRLPLSTGGAS